MAEVIPQIIDPDIFLTANFLKFCRKTSQKLSIYAYGMSTMKQCVSLCASYGSTKNQKRVYCGLNYQQHDSEA